MSKGTASNKEGMTKSTTPDKAKKCVNLGDTEHEQSVTEPLCTSLEKALALYDGTTITSAHFSDSAMRDGMYTTPTGGSTEPIVALAMEKGESIEFIIVNMPPFPTNHTDISAINLDRSSLEAFEFSTDNGTGTEGALTN